MLLAGSNQLLQGDLMDMQPWLGRYGMFGPSDNDWKPWGCWNLAVSVGQEMPFESRVAPAGPDLSVMMSGGQTT